MSNTVSSTIDRPVLTADMFIRQANAASSSNMLNENDKFNNLDLNGITLENKSLERAEFHCSQIVNTVFTGVNFQGAEFHSAKLENVTFVNCHLEYTHFDFAQFTHVTFTDCFMNDSTWDFTGGSAVFERCSLKGAEFPMSSLQLECRTCNLMRAAFNGCTEAVINADGCCFMQGEFNDSTLKGSIQNSVFTNAEFNAADAAALSLESCKLRDISTRGAVGLAEDEDDEDDDFDFL